MNKFLAILLLSCALVSCKSCSKDGGVTPLPTSSVVVPPIATTQTVVDDHFKLVVPADWDKRENPLETNIKAMYSNNEKQSLVMVSYQPFLSSTDELVLVAVRELKDNGVSILSAENVILNGESVVLLSTEQGGVIAYMWLVAKNGYSYQLSCGSQSTNLKDMCTTIANTLQLK